MCAWAKTDGNFTTNLPIDFRLNNLSKANHAKCNVMFYFNLVLSTII